MPVLCLSDYTLSFLSWAYLIHDVLRLLGYEVRGADGRLVTANYSLFHEEETLLIELRKQGKERNKNE